MNKILGFIVIAEIKSVRGMSVAPKSNTFFLPILSLRIPEGIDIIAAPIPPIDMMYPITEFLIPPEDRYRLNIVLNPPCDMESMKRATRKSFALPEKLFIASL